MLFRVYNKYQAIQNDAAKNLDKIFLASVTVYVSL